MRIILLQTVFSVNLGKQFAPLDKGKNKVRDFLESVGLADRLVGKDESIIRKMNAPVDYRQVDLILDHYRKTSRDYLKKALNNN